MESVLDPIAASAAAAEASRDAQLRAPAELGREDFLRLLVAKLENQDPLDPTQDTEFISQLATFSSLEQLISANGNLRDLALGQSTLINSQALSLIGKEALVASDGTIRIDRGAAESIVYSLPASARQATLTIYRTDGTPVRAFGLDTTPGVRHKLEWDGTDENGDPLDDGEYRVEVTAVDLDGGPMVVDLFESLRIDGVRFGADGMALLSGGLEIPFEMIVEFRDGSPEEPAPPEAEEEEVAEETPPPPPRGGASGYRFNRS